MLDHERTTVSKASCRDQVWLSEMEQITAYFVLCTTPVMGRRACETVRFDFADAFILGEYWAASHQRWEKLRCVWGCTGPDNGQRLIWVSIGAIAPPRAW